MSAPIVALYAAGGCGPQCGERTGFTASYMQVVADGRFHAAARFADQTYGFGDGGTIVRVGSGGVTPVDVSLAVDLHAALAGERLIVAGARGTIVALKDGIWTVHKTGVSADLYALAAAGRTIVAVGDGVVLLSHDAGTTWKTAGGGDPGALRAVTAFGPKFVAFGAAGQMIEIVAELDGFVALAPTLGGPVRAASQTADDTLTIVRDDGEVFTLISQRGVWHVFAGAATDCGMGERDLGDYILCDDGTLLTVDGQFVDELPVGELEPIGAAAMVGDGVAVFGADGSVQLFTPQFERVRCDEGGSFVG